MGDEEEGGEDEGEMVGRAEDESEVRRSRGGTIFRTEEAFLSMVIRLGCLPISLEGSQNASPPPPPSASCCCASCAPPSEMELLTEISFSFSFIILISSISLHQDPPKECEDR